MTRLQQIEEIFQGALQRDPAERDAYVREACGADNELQREIISLLANHDRTGDSEIWAAAAAAKLIDGPASLQPGHCLGPYRIECFLAAGGMGEVYRATDTRLNRAVAIKVSAARFSERFQREARLIASLNHPNICQLYDVGPNYLVMELVEGENLSGALPVETALNYAQQIAEALEAAHEKGIVHRDLKPSNVKITPAGVVKVLDFGLAKAVEEPAAADHPTDSPTLTMSPTRAGIILGTAPYMSPEQARGAAVDKRADIWAFGCVLYEMLTGKQAFRGETTSDILAAVLKEDPDWSRIPAKAHPLLRRCLVKDPKRRLRDIGDAMPLIEGAAEVAPASRQWAWVVAAVLAIAFGTALVGWWRANRSAPPHPLVQLSAELSPDTTLDRYRGGDQLAVSPDGTRIVAAVRDSAGSQFRLVTRRLDQSEFAPLPGTEGANAPFFSPDGQWIAFFAEHKLKKVPVQGGSPVTLCDAPTVRASGSWGDDDKIIAALNDAEGILWRIPSSGGVPVPVTELDKKNGEKAQRNPQILPGSQAVLFTSFTTRLNLGDGDIDVLSFKTGARKTLYRGGVFGRYLPASKEAGYLVYMHENTLFAAPFNLRSLAVTGAPQPVLEDLMVAGLGGSWEFDFSRVPSGPGTFVYASWKGQHPWSIFWIDRAGKTQPLHPTPGFYNNPRFSPDGKRLAFGLLTDPARGDIWVKDLERGTASRLTSLPGHNSLPIWTPDGKDLFFEAIGPVAPAMYWIRSDGSGEPQRLTNDGIRRIPSSFSPDGKQLAYTQSTDSGIPEIWTAPIEGDVDHPKLGKAELFVRTASPGWAASPEFSPDGRWLAYISNETGISEVYVRPFPGPGGRLQISTGGGSYSVWSRNQRELFYLGADRRIMVVRYVASADSFSPGRPQVWSETRPVEAPVRTWDLAPDGQHVAGILYADGTSKPKPSTQLTVLLNFFDELKRRVPMSR